MHSPHRLELRLFVTCAFVWLLGAKIFTLQTVASTRALPTAIESEYFCTSLELFPIFSRTNLNKESILWKSRNIMYKLVAFDSQP